MKPLNTLEGAWEYRRESIAARLLREGIKNDSNEEITRCLADCCGSTGLINLTLAAKSAGLFSCEWLKSQNEQVA